MKKNYIQPAVRVARPKVMAFMNTLSSWKVNSAAPDYQYSGPTSDYTKVDNNQSGIGGISMSAKERSDDGPWESIW